jgi:tRNA A-37 threonylcarbamoyl transferase component Bud32
VKQSVGSYEVVRVLARGGMAVVYLARQPTLDREVALKRLQLESTDPTLARRFVREARLAAGLDHPNVVTLFDFFEDSGVPYIAMEYVGGGSLRRLVGHLSLPQIFGVLEGVLAGLAHAESRGIAHRDLKPENVLVTREGGVKIADFGIARAYNALTPSLTQTDSAIGTPSYMAPEQVTGDALGPFTDLYAVGVIAYELLSGHPPFNSDTPPVAVLYRHVHTPPPPLSELAPDAPAPACEWVEHLLEKDPAARPPSAAEASQALEEIAVDQLGPYWRRDAPIRPDASPVPTLATAVVSTDTPVTPTTRRVPHPRRRGAAIAAVTAVAAAGAASAVVLLGHDSPPPAKDRRSRPSAALAPPAAAPALAYDFDGDHHRELVLGMPESGSDHAGVVVVRSGNRRQVITPADAGLKPPYDLQVEFGRNIASGDFNRDGRADLAMSASGRDTVSVMNGTKDGLGGSRPKIIRRGNNFRSVPGAGRFASRMVAADMNNDKFDDLVLGAPDADTGRVGSGIIQILYGSRRGLTAGSAKEVQRPQEDLVAFGTAMRVGDFDGNGYLDLVEGAADGSGGNVLGHGSFCMGHKGGLGHCQLLTGPASSGTSGLAVADVNGDGRDDIIQGDAIVEPRAVGRGAVGGEVRVWFGGRHRPARTPVVIDQRPDEIPGTDTINDGFGTSIGAGRLDGDRFADMVISAPGDNAGDGQVTVIRGGPSGYRRAANTTFGIGNGLPGERGAGWGAGWAISVMDIAGNRRPEVIVVEHGAPRLGDAVVVIQPYRGAFAPDETRVWKPFDGFDGVKNANIERIRIGREAGS